MFIINKLAQAPSAVYNYFVPSSTTGTTATTVAKPAIKAAAAALAVKPVKKDHGTQVREARVVDFILSDEDKTKLSVEEKSAKYSELSTKEATNGKNIVSLSKIQGTLDRLVESKEPKKVSFKETVSSLGSKIAAAGSQVSATGTKLATNFETKVWHNATLDKVGDKAAAVAKNGTKATIVVLGAIGAVVAAPFIMIAKLAQYVYNKAIKPAALFIYNKAILPAARAIKNAIVWTYNHTLGILFTKIGNAFKAAMKSFAKALAKALIEVVKEDDKIRAELNSALKKKPVKKVTVVAPTDAKASKVAKKDIKAA